MNELEIRGNALISELTVQRNSALDRCAVLAADLAIAQARLKQAETEKTEKPAQPKKTKT